MTEKSVSQIKNYSLDYNRYQKECLKYLEFDKKENHDEFLKCLTKIMDICFSFDKAHIRERIGNIIKEVLDTVNQKTDKSSIYHWVQDLINFPKKLNYFEEELDIINKSIRDYILEMKTKYKGKNIGKFYDELMKYLGLQNFIDMSMKNYLLNECGCDEIYFDKKGDKYFCYAPENSERGGKKYEVPVDCIAYGLEVTERYGDDEDWLANDGRKEEWAVGYYGFGIGMNEIQIKEIIKTIVHDKIRPCSKQFFVDINNNLETKGDAIYITPDLEEASDKAFIIPLANNDYNLIIMVRVNPKSIIKESETESNKKYWIIEDSSQIRPYRILLKNKEKKIKINNNNKNNKDDNLYNFNDFYDYYDFNDDDEFF